MNKKKFATIISFIALFSYFSLQIIKLANLQTVKVARGQIDSSVYSSGKTKSEKEASLSFKSTGRIVYLPFKKNQEVKKGQIVATVDTSDLVAAKQKDLEDYLKTRWDFEQIKNDTYKGQVETDTIKRAKEKTQFDLNKAVYDFEISDRALKNASLYSPFDGIITTVNGELNEWVSSFSTVPLISIIDPTTVYFEVELEEENIEKILAGQRAVVTLDAYPKKQFRAVVSEIDKKAIIKDNGDTVLPVKLTFSRSDFPLAVGLNGDAQFILESKKNILLLPKRAVKKKNGNDSVTVKKGFGLQAVQVVTGVSDSKNIEIIKGLGENDQVILSNELD